MGEQLGFTEFRAKFFELVEPAQSIGITAHFSPDDDSIASVLAMRYILVTKFPEKNITVLYGGGKVDRWSAIQHFDKIEFVDDIASHLEKMDVLVVLDVNQYARFTKFPEKISDFSQKIVIDHHKSAPDTFALSLIESNFSSNVELIYRIFADGSVLERDLAEPLLLGILGDTGNFAFVRPHQTETFILAKELIDTLQISIDEFRSRYSGIPVRLFPLLQELYKNTQYISLNEWPAAQYSFINQDAITAEAFTDEDISAASHIYMGQFLPRMQGYTWGFVITARSDGVCRMSSRSLPQSVNVRILHEQLGIGSGHDRASGGIFNKGETVSESITKVLEWMKNNSPVLG